MCCFNLDMQPGKKEITITKQKTSLPDLLQKYTSQTIHNIYLNSSSKAPDSNRESTHFS